MARRLILSPFAVMLLVTALMAGELASGTSLYFVTMMAIAMLSACVTYNVLGGLGTIGGIGFTAFALSTLVIGQVAKVILFEPADQNLDVPQLTITVYAVFFFFLMLGTLTFCRLRLPLPKPSEVMTEEQSRYVYAIALAGGMVGSISFTALNLAGEAAATSSAHAFARALAYLLPFSLVVAVDNRIRATGGRHSIGWMAVWPTLTTVLLSFVGAGRGTFMQPFMIIFLTCYLRNFRFRRKHLAAAVGLTAVLFLFISPLYLWMRAWRGDPTIKAQAATMWRLLQAAPSQWATITHDVGAGQLAATGLVNYFPSVGAVTLNRIVLIGDDSTLINACSSGFHYGFTSLKLDLLSEIPRFLYRNKPDIGSNEYLGHLDGQENDEFLTTFTTITPIADSYGAFSWLGVVAFAFLAYPAVYVVYESIFDVSRPWGTVATLLMTMGTSMGSVITEVMIKGPVYVLIISWCVAWCIRFIPTGGDRAAAPQKNKTKPLFAVAAHRPQ